MYSKEYRSIERDSDDFDDDDDDTEIDDEGDKDDDCDGNCPAVPFPRVPNATFEMYIEERRKR